MRRCERADVGVGTAEHHLFVLRCAVSLLIRRREVVAVEELLGRVEVLTSALAKLPGQTARDDQVVTAGVEDLFPVPFPELLAHVNGEFFRHANWDDQTPSRTSQPDGGPMNALN